MKKVFCFALILCLGCFCLSSAVFAASARQELVDDGMIVQAMKRGTLRVGLSAFVPWAMPDKTGRMVGFEVDVATRLAKDLGLKLELVPTDWGGIIPALLSGKFETLYGMYRELAAFIRRSGYFDRAIGGAARYDLLSGFADGRGLPDGAIRDALLADWEGCGDSRAPKCLKEYATRGGNSHERK